MKLVSRDCMEEFIHKFIEKVASEAGLFDCGLIVAIYYLHKDRARALLDSKHTTQSVISALESNTASITDFKEKLAFLTGSITHQHNDK